MEQLVTLYYKLKMLTTPWIEHPCPPLYSHQKEFYLKISSDFKKNIIYWIKFLLIFSILFFVGFTFIAPLTRLATISVILIISFLMVSLIYFAYKANKEERETLLFMWKVYFSVLTILLIFFYSTEDKLRLFVLDYYKTKLNYELKTKSTDINNTFSEYENIVTSHINNNKKEDVNISVYENKQKVNKEKFYTIWYGNISINFMNVITLFMFLWFVVEFDILNIKKSNKVIRYITKKHNKTE